MSGTLVDVFEITGRGCVVLVDVISGDCRVGETLEIGEAQWEISGIDIPRYSPDTVKKIEQGWKPPLGLLLQNAQKDELSKLIGRPCSTVDKKADFQ